MPKPLEDEGKPVVLEDQERSKCPVRDLISRLGDKWSILILISLAKANGKSLRFSELTRAISGISQRMLSTTLRYLERDGIETRHAYPEVPPRVEYALTKRGREFLVPVEALFRWIESEWPEIEKSRKEYDVNNRKTDQESGSA